MQSITPFFQEPDQPAQYYYTRGNIPVVLDKPLERGGEGTVYTLRHSPGLLAKLYHKSDPGLTAWREAKLRTMLAMPQAANSGRYAWPISLVHTIEQGRPRFCGFVMRRMAGISMDSLIVPSLLLHRIPAARNGDELRLYVLRVIYSLASGLSELQARGVLPGDISAANFLVHPESGAVSFIDCDSYQVPRKGPDGNVVELYTGGVATPEYLPPELLASNTQAARTAEHVWFSAAVLFFSLLTHGGHPYQCIGAQSPVENIKAGRTAMGSSHGLATGYYPKPIYLAYRALHPAIKQVLIQTLVRGHRQPALRADFGAWIRASNTGANAIERALRERGTAP